MSDGSGWYPGQRAQHGYAGQQQQSPPTDPRQTLASYPFAAATPTSHVARHLSSLTIRPPSAHTFTRPAFYQQHLDYSANPPPYTDYGQNSYLAPASALSSTPTRHWQPNPAQYHVAPHHVLQSTHWQSGTQQYIQPHYSSSSSLANALGPTMSTPGHSTASSSLQHTFVESKRPQANLKSYSSESSLSGALGPLSETQQPAVSILAPPPDKRHMASDSAAFLDDLLAHESQVSSNSFSQSTTVARTPSQTSVTSQGSPVKAHGARNSQQLQTSPQRQQQIRSPAISQRLSREFELSRRADPTLQPRAPQPQVYRVDISTSASIHPPAPAPIAPFRVPKHVQEPESPDPLALDMGPTYSSPSVMTPRKRKPVDLLESPSKRMQSPSNRDISQSSVFMTPSKHNKVVLTPSTSRSSFSSTTPSTQNTFKTPSTGSTVKHVPFVELPRLPKDWLTPVKKKSGSVKMLSSGDLGGYGSDSDDETNTPLSKQLLSSAQRTLLRSSGRRTGDRDDRAPLEKFTELLEDIFEAEDNLPSDGDTPADASFKLFSSLTNDWTRPLLAPTTVRKLTTIVGKVARPPKRDRLTMGLRDSPRKAPRGLAEMDTQMLGRVLKILERSVRAGEDLDPFAGPPAGPGAIVAPPTAGSPSKKSPSKKKRAHSESRTPQGESIAGDNVHAVDVDFDKLDGALGAAKEAVIAADCIIALLSADKLPKQLYSEELITACLSTVKNLLDKIIYPFVEANSDLHGQSSLALLHVARDSAGVSSNRRALIGEIFHSLSSVFPRIDALISRSGVAMSDKIIIQSVFIAIGPFFVVEFGTEGSKSVKEKAATVVLNALGGTAALRGLRLSALALIRSIFANHSDQRSWIIEEILTSLIKLPDLKQKAGQFRLRDGRSIHTVSALLLQLVQTSAHDVRIEARKLALGRQQSAVFKTNDSFTEVTEIFLTDRDREEIVLYTNGLDSATKAAKTIVAFLTQRAGKGKNTKNTNEAEYRAIFDNLISDLLAVLFWPEWPSASLLLDIICKFMVSSLDDVKTASTNDSNGAKASALDHLGTVAARLRTSILRFSHKESARSKDTYLRPLEEVVSKLDISLLDRLVAAHEDITNHLAKRSSEDQAYDSAQELTAASWGHEIAVLLPRCESMLKSVTEEGIGSKSDKAAITTIVQKMKSAMRTVWKSTSNDVFDVGTEEEIVRVDRLAEEVGTIQGLKNAFDPILTVVLMALDSPAVFMRSKALRALGHIVTSDPDILRNPKVRAAIESHLLDSSPAVRDAAVELIGKYIIQLPEVAADYYQRIADRIADTGLGVRKRVIKLLKMMYLTTDDSARRVDICSKLVLRQLDEDDTVKELATKTIEELWFNDGIDGSGKKSITDTRAALLSKANVIMNVTGVFKDRQIPLEDLLHRIVSDKEGKDANAIHSRYNEICDVLIEGLVDSQEFVDFNVVYCIKTVYLFSTAHPGVISFSKAATLLPYLKNPSNAEEQLISDYLLKIFRSSLPLMPKTAAKFGAELQQTLQPMIVKPSPSGGLSSLQETVACMCSVVQYITHDYVRLVGLLKSCNAKVQDFLKKPADTNPAALRPLSILIFIVSLLTEHCDFDRVRREITALAAELDMVSKDSVSLHVYRCLLALYRKFPDGSMRPRLLQCLGFLFRAYPTLMTLETSAEMMDAIFASPEDDVRGRLLKIIQDFLISESLKHSAREKESKNKDAASISMDKLVGNTHDFAESGVAAAIVQRYLPQILDASVTKHAQVQTSAMDILTFTIKQGLAHPLQCLPTIVALETSSNTLLSARANALHAVLHSKHASLVTSRYVECARKSFDYQMQMSNSAVCGYRSQPSTTALFHRWYSLVREKRTARQDYLKAIVRVFDVDATILSSKQDDIDFARYMAENIATLDYKTQEEVLTVIRHLTSILSVAGAALVEVVSPSNLLRQLHDDAAEAAMDIDTSHGLNCAEPISLARTSVIIAMILVLKSHLKALYTISEEKALKWIPGKKSAVGDRPAARRGDAAIVWDHLPYATQPISSPEDAIAQFKHFLTLWSEDGTSMEPVEDAE